MESGGTCECAPAQRVHAHRCLVRQSQATPVPLHKAHEHDPIAGSCRPVPEQRTSSPECNDSVPSSAKLRSLARMRSLGSCCCCCCDIALLTHAAIEILTCESVWPTRRKHDPHTLECGNRTAPLGTCDRYHSLRLLLARCTDTPAAMRTQRTSASRRCWRVPMSTSTSREAWPGLQRSLWQFAGHPRLVVLACNATEMIRACLPLCCWLTGTEAPGCEHLCWVHWMVWSALPAPLLVSVADRVRCSSCV